MSDAIGMIETRGLVGAITAADAALKTADVALKGTERVDPALVTVTVTGEVAAVRAAVDAGAAAAEKIGELIASHVIARPHPEVDPLFGSAPSGSFPAEKPQSHDTSSTGKNVPDFSRQDLETMPVTELRRLARQIADVGLRGRAISGATRQELVKVLSRTARS